MTGWILGVVLSLVLGIIAAFRCSAELGLGVAVVVSLLFPTWLELHLGEVSIGIRTAVSLVAIVAYALRFPKRIYSPISALDGVMAGIVILNVVSDIENGGSWGVPFIAYAEWALPYVTARYAMRDVSASEQLSRWVSVAIVILSVGGAIESVSMVNPWEQVFGIRDGEFIRHSNRFGFKRAFGNTIHPIFFAMQIVVLLPWALSMISWERSRIGKSLAVACVAIAVVGCASTVSRGPALVLIAIFVLALAILYVWARWLVGITTVAIAALLIANPVDFIKSIGDTIGERERQIVLDGEELPMTGSLARLWLYKAYAPALAGAGPFGYGTEAVSTFPVNVPRLPQQAKTIRSLRWIDNAYILIGLRFGWLGIIVLVVFFATNFVTGCRLMQDRVWRAMGLWSASMMLACALVLLSVYLDYDFGFIVLWMSGCLGGIAAWRRGVPAV